MKDLRDAVRDFVEALNQRALDTVRSSFTPDCEVDVGPWFDRPLRGPAAVAAFFDEFLRALPGLQVAASGVFVSRDEAVVSVKVRATMSQLNPDPVHIPEWRGGWKVLWTGAFLMTFTSERRISSFRIFGDSSDLRWLPREAPPT